MIFGLFAGHSLAKLQRASQRLTSLRESYEQELAELTGFHHGNIANAIADRSALIAQAREEILAISALKST